MSWRVEVPEDAPGSVLQRLSKLVADWPGEDELEVVIGERRLVVHVCDCGITRRQVERLIGGVGANGCSSCPRAGALSPAALPSMPRIADFIAITCFRSACYALGVFTLLCGILETGSGSAPTRMSDTRTRRVECRGRRCPRECGSSQRSWMRSTAHVGLRSLC